MKHKLTIGEQLKIARESSGKTQREVSELSRVSLFTISGLEVGRIQNVSTHTIRALQFALGIVFEI